jgi:hypothetical protein
MEVFSLPKIMDAVKGGTLRSTRLSTETDEFGNPNGLIMFANVGELGRQDPVLAGQSCAARLGQRIERLSVALEEALCESLRTFIDVLRTQAELRSADSRWRLSPHKPHHI